MGLGERVKILEEAAFHPPPQPQGQSRPTTAGQPYLPFFCSKSSSYFRVRSRDSRFHFFLTPVATSGPTAAGQPYRFKSSAPHPAEPELPSARVELRALRSAERRPWSLPFAPLSPVPPEVEPYLPRKVGLGRRAPPTCRQRREWV
jgi:hypothetical protein